MIELAAILVLGMFSQWLAWRVKLPAILPLIIIGLMVGPLSTFITADGEKLIDGDAIFNGDVLFAFVALSVGVILFEGGLTLKLKEIRHLAHTVRNLLTIGAAITWIGGSLAAYYLLGMHWKISLLFGALIIVTGPTVIAPILRNIRPTKNINTVLKWEGILIDPIGALVAVLVYEFIRFSKPGDEYTLVFFTNFFLTILVGAIIGTVSALALYFMIRKRLLPGFLKNIVTLALVVGTFAISDAVYHESGLLAVTLMGMILGNMRIEELKNLLSFKEDISVILISLLFIILSSRIQIQDIESLGFNSIILFLVVIFLLRPLAVFMSTFRSNLSFREKVFISWIGPRGIVAAAVASLFSLEIMKDTSVLPAENRDAALLLPLTFLIIIGTVILQGGSAKYVLSWLGLTRKEPQGVLFVGANEIARFLARYLRDNDVPVLLADTAHSNIMESKSQGLPVYEGSILSDDALEEIDLADKGRLFALTSNTEINILAMRKFREEFGEDHTLRLMSQREMEFKELIKPRNLLFGTSVDYIQLIQAIRRKPNLQEMEIPKGTDLKSFLNANPNLIPFFIKKSDARIEAFSGQSLFSEEGDILVYIGDLDQPKTDSEVEEEINSQSESR
ncbi:MAG: sodium:proton antiporter [Bacteroidia bacterium]